MSRIVKQKYKISRRLGVNLWGRAKDPVETRKYPPGVHGAVSGYRKKSDYGTQLFAKQMLKGYYAMSEKQFRKVYKEASNLKGDTSEKLVGILETRLDMALFRLNFAPTIFSAKQIVSHNHVKVNGKVVNIRSYRLKPNDVIEIKEKSRENVQIVQAQEQKQHDVPSYFDVEGDKLKATFLQVPSFAEIPYPVQMQPSLVIEYYSR